MRHRGARRRPVREAGSLRRQHLDHRARPRRGRPLVARPPQRRCPPHLGRMLVRRGPYRGHGDPKFGLVRSASGWGSRGSRLRRAQRLTVGGRSRVRCRRRSRLCSRSRTSAFTASVKVWMASASRVRSATASMITGSYALSVAMPHRASRSRFFVLRDVLLQLNHTALSSHAPHTGVRCGRPSDQVVVTQ